MLKIDLAAKKERVFRMFMNEDHRSPDSGEPSWYSWKRERRAWKDGYSSGYWAARNEFAVELTRNADKIQDYLKDIDENAAKGDKK